MLTVFYYEADDKDFSSDYTRVQIENFMTGEVYAKWGDAYHDRGREKAEGWEAGYLFALRAANPQADIKPFDRENRNEED